MAKTAADKIDHVQLRLDAETCLQQGSAPPTQGWALSSNALAILYKLASAPDSAGEGLRLLHELQTHQVELDLQYEQLVANEREFAHGLARYKALYDFAPVGYLVVDHDGRIVESNQAGAKLFGAEPDELAGSLFHSFISSQSRPVLNKMLENLNRESASSFCVVNPLAAPPHAVGVARKLRISASISSGSEAILMIVSEFD